MHSRAYTEVAVNGLEEDLHALPEQLRARRVGQNQSLFRDVNEQAAEAASRLDNALEFLCECAQLDCSTYLTVRLEDYERIRSNARRFFVAKGHEIPKFENVVEEGPGWVVVEKFGIAGQTAKDEDPRET